MLNMLLSYLTKEELLLLHLTKFWICFSYTSPNNALENNLTKDDHQLNLMGVLVVVLVVYIKKSSSVLFLILYTI